MEFFIMNDIRFRLASVLILSVTAFLGVVPSAAVFIWWIVFAAKRTFQKFSLKTIILTLVLAAGFPSAVLFFTGGDAFYGVKIAVIVLIAFWFGSECKANDFMNLFVWLFGKKSGFNLGLSAEFSMTALKYLKDDFVQMRDALKIKGRKVSVSTIPSLSFGLLAMSIRRAEMSSLILARRGYVSGGTFEPEFFPSVSDYAAFISAVLITAVTAVLYCT
ncbi:MAG: hypothetical protein Q4Q53_04440 [Methanocorpusculum sp.]|nr:hypothetical protein [Methanocorpusculum sp.]